MTSAYQDFQILIRDTRNTSVLYDYLHDYMNAPLDYSDLLRWQWAQSVSALDKLLHDLIRIGMREAFSGTRQSTAAFNAFSIDIITLQRIKQNPLSKEIEFEKYVSAKHAQLSFQMPEKIAGGLALIWTEQHKWQAIAVQMGRTEVDVKTELTNIVTRRNQIVHQGDYAASGQPRQNIEKADTERTVNFIEQLGTAIYTLVSAP